jgi:Glu-tRNA(Gln) amidotransferase subunit E-like FAD-binding protein
MSADNDPRRPLDGILDGLAESVAHEDSDELLEEAQAAGESPEFIAQKLKAIAFVALKKFEQRKLEAAREAYYLRTANAPENKESIASTPDERKRQLFAILESNPDIGKVLTAQHRGLENLSDEDVQSALEDLAELGFLGDTPGTPCKE